MRILFSLLAFAGLISCLPAQPGDQWLTMNLSSLTRSVRLADYADIDGDGLDDIVGVQSPAPATAFQPFWMKNLGGGEYSLPVHLPGADGQTVVRATDWDSDGDVDILLLTVAGSEEFFQWYENKGGHPIEWTKRVFHENLEFGTDRYVLKDVNGDDIIDVLTFNTSGIQSVCTLWLGDGSGGLNEPVSTPPGAMPYSLSDPVVRDLDGDGVNEIVFSRRVISPDGPTLETGYLRLTADAAPALSAYHRLASLADYPGFSLTDLNQDGRPDVLSETDAGRVFVNLSVPDSAHTDTLHLPDVRPPVQSMDVNRDGLIDLLFPNADGFLSVRLANPVTAPGSLPTFSEPRVSNLKIDDSFGYKTLDANHTTPRLLLSGINRQLRSLKEVEFSADGNLVFRELTPPLDLNTLRVATDPKQRRTEFYASTSSENWPAAYRITRVIPGDTAYYRARQFYVVPDSMVTSSLLTLEAHSTDLGDVNGDGRLDAVTVLNINTFQEPTEPEYHTFVQLSASEGGYHPIIDLPDSQERFFDVKILPGDAGSVSAIARTYISREDQNQSGEDKDVIRISRNHDRDGVPDSHNEIISEGRFPRSFSYGDGNGDGYLDLACGVDYHPSFIVYFNPGNDTYNPKIELDNTLDDWHYGFAFTDIDRDGLDDIVGFRSGVITYFLATDPGVARSGGNAEVFSSTFMAEDLDGDGDADFFLAQNPVSWLENLGETASGPLVHREGSVEVDQNWHFYNGFQSNGGGFLDMDADGDKDLFYARGHVYYVRNFQKDGQLRTGAFYDANENGIREENENLIVGFRTTINPVPEYVETYADGEKIFYTDQDAVRINISPSPGWRVAGDTIRDITFGENDARNGDYFFPATPLPGEAAYVLDMQMGVFRCNSEVPLWLIVTNQGIKETEPYWLDLSLPAGVGFAVAPDSIAAGSGFFRIPPLAPGAVHQLLIVLNAPGPELLGEDFPFFASLNYRNGADSLTASAGISPELRCSYDPNDKQVFPNGIKEEDVLMSGTRLLYTIRFQNTGNDTAFLVTLRDTLDPDLDWGSIEMTATSHDCLLEVNARTGEATFTFANILLLAQSENDALSQGYVSFSINHRPGLPDLTPINNRASIYFDRNPPIHTNNTLRRIEAGDGGTDTDTVASSLQVLPEGSGFELSPNPAAEVSVLTLSANVWKFSSPSAPALVITDGLGRTVRRRFLTAPVTKLRTDDLSTGIYFVTVFQAGVGAGTQRLVVR